MLIMRLLLCVVATVMLAGGAHAADPARPQAASTQEAIDWVRARQLHQRFQRGDRLSPEEQAYYDRARAARPQQTQLPAPTPADSKHLPPLTDSTDPYKGSNPGLYGDGQNAPPDAHLKAAMAAAGKIAPLDHQGKPSPEGRIVLMSVGMSNTTQEFSTFVRLASADPRKRGDLVIVDGAQGGRAADSWASPDRMEAWQEAGRRLLGQEVTRYQVQVLWVKQARITPAQLGEFPAHAEALQRDLGQIVSIARQQFPNLKLIYFSSRTYGGWASTHLNPEPYAFESAFSVQWLIREQMEHRDAQLAYDNAPVLLWGPYLWTDGTKGRKDGLRWEQADTAPDGTHPSPSGREKVAKLLLEFFTTDPTARAWFVQ